MAAPFHVRGVVDPGHTNHKGQLSAFSADVHTISLNYDAVIMMKKIDTFFISRKTSMTQ